MKKIELEELKKIQVNILEYVDDFCKKNQIRYWIDCGTLLGAVRHKGFIPWDDDIDIGMLREDYEKFLKLFINQNTGKYQLYCYETDKSCSIPYGKILDTSTILYEPDEKTGIKSSVFVDLFPYDNAPAEEEMREKMFQKRDFLKNLCNLQKYKGFYTQSKTKYNFVRYPIHMMLQVFPQDFFIKKRIKKAKEYNDRDTGFVGNFTGGSKQYCSKDVFKSFVELDFEGKKYPAPVGYDQWLTSFYGDYMQLPPKEKQVSHHRFVAFYK